jgi:glycosyltransferase involved in cell wall biosynthesis
MRILLIGNYALDKQESMLRYGALLERELIARGHTARLLQPRAFASRSSSGGVGKWLGYLDKFVLFPFALKRALRDFDVVHICDHSNSMYTRYLADKPNVVTCHDVLAITSALGEHSENAVSATGRKLQQMILRGLRAAQYVVCVSTISRTEMLRVTGRPRETSEVIYSSLGYPYAPMPPELAVERLDALGFDPRTPFFLHVGGASWYKNRLGLMQIFACLQKMPSPPARRLLVVGGAFESDVQRFIDSAGLAASITRLSGLSNEDLRAVYSLAEAFLFPSLKEGFGWPVIEAQACGCPVFATGREPMTEIGGDAAVYFDPADPAGAASVIARALLTPGEIRRRGLENVQRFSVDTMIDGLLRVYEHVVATSKYT